MNARASLSLLLLLSSGCGVAPAPSPAAPRVEPKIAVASAEVVVASRATEPVAPRRAQKQVQCQLPAPIPDPPTMAASGRCHPPSLMIQANLRASMSKSFEIVTPGGRAEVSFACDGLGQSIREVVVESGEGHGQNLELWHAKLSEDGERYDIDGVAYGEEPGLRLVGRAMIRNAQGQMVELNPKPPPRPFRISRGVVDKTQIRQGIEEARQALFSSIREIDPPPPPNSLGLSGSSFSSRDFHVLVKLTDTDGRTIEKEFTGYQGSGDQERFIPLEEAEESLRSITSVFPLEDQEPTDQDRSFFAERFHASAPRFSEQYHWWVTERLVSLSKDLGTPPVLRDLLGRIKPDAKDRSEVDARRDAIEAFVKIGGWDPREDLGGETADPSLVAQAYQSGCK